MTLTEQDIQFHEELCEEDELGSVIRAHLHIERLLNELIDNLLEDPRALDELRLDFYGKVVLAAALGLKKEYKAPIVGVGKIRNKYAHQIGFKITKSDANNLYSSFTPEWKEIIQSGYREVVRESGGKYPKFGELTPRNLFTLCAVHVHTLLIKAVSESV